MSAKRSWTPIHRGSTYCSPACGGETKWGCTFAAWENAHLQAKALAKLMGPGWLPRVWENLGWHYAVLLGSRVSVSPPGPLWGTYTADINVGRQFFASDVHPRRAFRKALRLLDADMEQRQRQRSAIAKMTKEASR